MKYDAVLHSPSRTVFEIQGPSVQCLSENELVEKDGNRIHTGKADPVNMLFAQNFTQHYAELAQRDLVFADLKNIFDLSLVAALMMRERLITNTEQGLRRLCRGRRLRNRQIRAAQIGDVRRESQSVWRQRHHRASRGRRAGRSGRGPEKRPDLPRIRTLGQPANPGPETSRRPLVVGCQVGFRHIQNQQATAVFSRGRFFRGLQAVVALIGNLAKIPTKPRRPADPIDHGDTKATEKTFFSYAWNTDFQSLKRKRGEPRNIRMTQKSLLFPQKELCKCFDSSLSSTRDDCRMIRVSSGAEKDFRT